MDDPWMPPISMDFSTSSMDIHPDGPGSIHGSPWYHTATNSERFYNSIVGLFSDPEEQEEVNKLLAWWNR